MILKRGIIMKLTSLTTVANTFAKTTATTPAVVTKPVTTKAPATTKATPAVVTKPATTKATPATVPAVVVTSKPASTIMQAKAKLQHCKEQKKYGNFSIEELMPVMDKVYMGLKRFEKEIDKLWMKKRVITMEESDLFETFYALTFFEKVMANDITGAMFHLEDCVKELLSIKENYSLIIDYVDPKITRELEQVYSLL